MNYIIFLGIVAVNLKFFVLVYSLMMLIIIALIETSSKEKRNLKIWELKKTSAYLQKIAC